MERNNENVELLAPVGNMDSLYASVQNGADAVYLGGKLFNARQSASNFDYEELKKAVEYSHLRGVKVYITVNILLDNSEIKDTIEYIKYLHDIDVDGIIVQDLGFADIARNVLPDLPLHGSTQMTINNLQGTLFLEEMGFTRVVLARELSTSEIRHIKDRSKIELEGFIHGALCVCYSGQCLLSSIIGGRSGNRGRCAQPCRMPYTLVDIYNDKVVSKEYEKKYLLSPKDLNTIDYLNEVIDSGIISLKIEGRMKRPEYVAVIVSKYRKVIDRLKEDKNDELSENEKKEILEIFNRGFTKGYILGDYGKDFISLDRPDNRGVYIGKVVKIDRRYIYISLEDNVEKGDGIELYTNQGEYYGLILGSSGSKGSTLKLDEVKGVAVGSSVFKTSSSSLLKRARESYENIENKKYGINMTGTFSIGKPAKLAVDDGSNTIEVISETLVEKGQKVFLTEEKVTSQLEKLTDTPYYIEKIDIFLDEGSFVSVSAINNLRREAIKLLNEKRQNYNHRIQVSDEEFNRRINHYNIGLAKEKVKESDRKISAKVRTLEQFKELNLDKLDRVYLNPYDGIEDCIADIKKCGKEVFVSTDKILDDDDLKKLENEIRHVEDKIDGILVSNIGSLKFFKDKFKSCIHGDIGLNVFNSYTVKLLKEKGINSLTLSPELNLNQIGDICKDELVSYETIGYGYLPLMVTKHCPFSVVKGCKNNHLCESCSFKEGFGLKDRKGKTFNLIRDNKITTLYNSVPIMVLDDLEHIYKRKVNMIRLDFTVEKDDIRSLQEAYYDLAHGNIDNDEVENILRYHKEKTGITKGHYYRGVL